MQQAYSTGRSVSPAALIFALTILEIRSSTSSFPGRAAVTASRNIMRPRRRSRMGSLSIRSPVGSSPPSGNASRSQHIPSVKIDRQHAILAECQSGTLPATSLSVGCGGHSVGLPDAVTKRSCDDGRHNAWLLTRESESVRGAIQRARGPAYRPQIVLWRGVLRGIPEGFGGADRDRTDGL